MADLQDTIENIKDAIPDITPTPPKFHSIANAHELKARLDWGEPALTILDVRDYESFNHCRIVGAMRLSLPDLQNGTQPSVATERDIYVYGANDEETATAANLIRQSGFTHVAELKGGLADWRSIGGAVEGIDTSGSFPPSADELNTASRLKEFSEEQSRENQMK